MANSTNQGMWGTMRFTAMYRYFGLRINRLSVILLSDVSITLAMIQYTFLVLVNGFSKYVPK